MASKLTYNNVEINDILTENFVVEPVYQGSAYLHSKVTLQIEGVLNPAKVSYHLPATPGRPASARVNAPITHEAIRHHLSQPRKQLRYEVGGKVLVDVAADSTIGPVPGPFQIYRVLDKTFFFRWSVTTYINECKREVSTASAITYHRWGMTSQIDKDFYSVRVITGRVVFDMARLSALGVRADDYRPDLFHAVQDGFKREEAEFTVLPDGYTAEYTLIDREVAIAVRTEFPNITRIEATHAVETAGPGTERFVTRVGMSTLRGVSRVVSGLGRTGLFTPFAGPAEAASAGIDLFAEMVDITLNHIPITSHQFAITVYGNKLSRRADLRTVAARIVAVRLGGFGAALSRASLSGFRVKLTEDLMGKVVRLEASILGSPLASLLAGEASPATPFSVMPETDEMTGITKDGRVAEIASPAMPRPFRATDRYSLVTQDLEKSCTSPAAIPVVPRAPSRAPAPGALP